MLYLRTMPKKNNNLPGFFSDDSQTYNWGELTHAFSLVPWWLKMLNGALLGLDFSGVGRNDIRGANWFFLSNNLCFSTILNIELFFFSPLPWIRDSRQSHLETALELHLKLNVGTNLWVSTIFWLLHRRSIETCSFSLQICNLTCLLSIFDIHKMHNLRWTFWCTISIPTGRYVFDCDLLLQSTNMVTNNDNICTSVLCMAWVTFDISHVFRLLVFNKLQLIFSIYCAICKLQSCFTTAGCNNRAVSHMKWGFYPSFYWFGLTSLNCDCVCNCCIIISETGCGHCWSTTVTVLLW